jgi:hypothetical protein
MSETPPISPPEPGAPGLGAIRSPSLSRLQYALRLAFSLPRESALSRDFISNLLGDAVSRAMAQGLSPEKVKQEADRVLQARKALGSTRATRRAPGRPPKLSEHRESELRRRLAGRDAAVRAGSVPADSVAGLAREFGLSAKAVRDRRKPTQKP